MITNASAVGALKQALGDAFESDTEAFSQPSVRYNDPTKRPEALRALKDHGFSFYSFCAAVDWPDENRFEILDHVYSYQFKVRITIRTNIPRDNPRLPSGTGVYRGADWHERETFDLFGVVFTGHPRLMRLLLPDWFEGYPLRKDFVLEARESKPWPADSFSG